MKTILFSGQSNCIGRGTGGIFPASSAVTVWNSQNDRNDLAGLGSAWVSANIAAPPFVNSRNNFGYHACRYLADLLGEPVRMIMVAQGNTAISQWANGAPMYERIKAVLAAAGVTTIDGLGWHQGEANSSDVAYGTKFNQFLTDLEGDGIITASTPVVVGEVAPKYTGGINDILRGLEGGRVKCARISTMETVDDIHFTGPMTVRVGWEYARCFRDLFTTPWSYSMGEYVSAQGNAAVSLPAATARKVPVAAVNGDASWINAAGAFVAPFAGVFQFDGTVYTGKVKTWARLLDDSNGIIASLAYGSDSTNPVVNGSAVLSLSEGDIVWLGASQDSGATVTLSAGNSAAYSKLIVRALEAFGA